MQKSYEYHPDSSLKFVEDELNGIFDRSQAYDHQGRTSLGKSSTEASGTTVTTDLDTQLPYRQSYGYNAFGNMTTRENLHWGTEQNLSYGYINNRITGWTYDADGRATTAREGLFYNYQEFDARGSLSRSYSDAVHGSTDIEPVYSGNGREEKRGKKFCNGTPLCYWQQLDPTYYIRSSVLGGEVISEVDHTGKKKQTFVYAAGAKIATQSISIVESVPVEGVTFEHSDAGGVTLRTTFSNGIASGLPVEFDPSGANAGSVTPYPEPDPEPEELEPIYQMLTDAPLMVNGFIPPCTIDGILLRGDFCRGIADRLNNGSAIPASIAWAQQNPGFSFTNHGFGIFSGHLGVDLWTNNTGKRWLQLTGTRGDGWMIGSGAFSFSLNWATQQSTTLQQTEPGSIDGKTVNDICKFLLPSNIPPGVSVDQNIRTAQEMVTSLRSAARQNAGGVRRSGDLGSSAAAAGGALAADAPGGSIDHWFESMVAKGNPWDYKRHGEIYEDFGNFNYGATGAAMGYSLDSLQRMAGWVQEVLREGESPLTKLQARLGYGGTYPYGDQRKDAVQISMGVSYYHCRKKNPL